MEQTIKELGIYISDGNYSSKYPRSEEFVEEGVPFIRGNNMVDYDITDEEMYYITPEKHALLLKGHIKAGDVLITTRGNIGQVAIVPKRHENSNINAQIVLLRTDPEKLYNRYLLWALQSNRSKEQYLALQTGTALKQLPVGKLEQLSIKITNINMQHGIADILDKVYAVIRLRRKELQLFDDLIKARFVEMFGDPVSNPFEWDIVAFDDCLESIENGKSFVCDSVARADEKPAILKLSAATHGVYKPEENKAIINEEDFVESAEVHDGDLLFTRKNTPELVGMAAYVESTPKKLMMPDLIFRLNTKTNCNKIFMWKLINHDLYRSQIESAASGSAKSMSNISKERLGKLRFPLPPLELQEQFVDFVKQVDKSKVIDTNIIPRGGFYNGHEFCISK